VRSMVGVEISSTAVRVARVRGVDSEGFAAVSAIGIAPLREGAVIAGKIKNHLVVSQALDRALEIAGARRYDFIIGFNAPDLAVGRLALPHEIKPEERVLALRTNDRQISPTLSLAQSVLSTNEVTVDMTGDGRAMTQLVVAAVLREELESFQRMIALAGCQPRAIDLSAAGLMRALVRARTDSSEVVTIVDIGETSTTIITRQGLHLRSVRVLTTGGRAITRAIMTETGEDQEAATKRRQLLQLGTESTDLPIVVAAPYGSTADAPSRAPGSTLLEEGVEKAVDQLLDQVATSIENDATNYGNTFTNGITLTGLTAQIPGLKNRLNQRLGVPVQLGRPWARLEKNRQNLPYLQDHETTANTLSEMSTAIGLALWKDPQA